MLISQFPTYSILRGKQCTLIEDTGVMHQVINCFSRLLFWQHWCHWCTNYISLHDVKFFILVIVDTEGLCCWSVCMSCDDDVAKKILYYCLKLCESSCYTCKIRACLHVYVQLAGAFSIYWMNGVKKTSKTEKKNSNYINNNIK